MGLNFRIAGNNLLLLGVFAFLFLLNNHSASCKEMNSLLEEIKEIEFTQIKYDERRADYYRYIEGQIPILISAPHGARHYRRSSGKGCWKKEDAYTSSLAIKLGQLTGAHVLYAKYKAREDPNSDARSAYKDFLRRAVTGHDIRFVVDLHGAGGHHDFKIDVGTVSDKLEECSCPTLRPIIQKVFQDFEGQIFNKQFAAGGCGTITSFVRNDLGIEAAQFEINARYRIVESRSDRSFKASEQDILDMTGRLQRMILDISESVGAKMK